MYSTPSEIKMRAKAGMKSRCQLTPVRLLGEPSPSLFPSRGEVLKLLLVVFIAGFAAIGCNFILGALNRRPKSFCDSRDASQDPGICEPCPQKGWCSNGKLECMHGYEKQGGECVESGQLYQTAKELAKVVEDDVCGLYAQVLCNRTGKIWFEEGDVMKMFDEHKVREDIRLEDDTFRLAIQKALEAMQGSLEMKANSNGSKEYKCPELLAELHKPLDCCIRQWLYRHSFLVTCVSAIVISLMWLSWILHHRQILSTRAEKLYEEVCEILEDNAIAARTKMEGDPWLVASWLRDHLLLPSERKDSKLWKKVEELIQEDSRIDKYPRLIKGDSKTVLEWQADGALSSRMKAKKVMNKTNKLSSHAHNRYYTNQEKVVPPLM